MSICETIWEKSKNESSNNKFLQKDLYRILKKMFYIRFRKGWSKTSIDSMMIYRKNIYEKKSSDFSVAYVNSYLLVMIFIYKKTYFLLIQFDRKRHFENGL